MSKLVAAFFLKKRISALFLLSMTLFVFNPLVFLPLVSIPSSSLLLVFLISFLLLATLPPAF